MSHPLRNKFTLRSIYQVHQIRFTTMTNEKTADLFRPPVNRTMQVLDRSFFKKKVLIGAVKVQDRKQISRLRSDLHQDMLSLGRLQTIQNIQEAEGRSAKAILLNPKVNPHGKGSRLCYYMRLLMY